MNFEVYNCVLGGQLTALFITGNGKMYLRLRALMWWRLQEYRVLSTVTAIQYTVYIHLQYTLHSTARYNNYKYLSFDVVKVTRTIGYSAL